MPHVVHVDAPATLAERSSSSPPRQGRTSSKPCRPSSTNALSWIHRTSWCGGRRALRRGLRARSRCGWWLNCDHLPGCQQPSDGSSSWEEQGEDGTGLSFASRAMASPEDGVRCSPCLSHVHWVVPMGRMPVGFFAPAERRSTRSGSSGWRAASPDSAKRTGTQGPAAASRARRSPS